MDPIKGGKKRGLKGAVRGFGKGMVGLVMKPVAGTLDLVTLTIRGIANTPTTIYLKLNSVFKEKKHIEIMKSPLSTPSKINPENELK